MQYHVNLGGGGSLDNAKTGVKAKIEAKMVGRPDAGKRHAFTPVEPLVVIISIIGMLVALPLLAVQSAREAARKMQCSSHFKKPRLAVAFFALSMLLSGSVAWGQNPVTEFMTVPFVRNGVVDAEIVAVPGVWNPNLQPWNGKFTVNGPTAVHPASGEMEKPRIGNVDTNLTFPIDPGGLNITAAEVNAYWDAQRPGATRIGEPTWSMNCHGYSSGAGYWVNDSTLFVYDWEICGTADRVTVGCVRGNLGHSRKVSGIVNYEHIRVVSEITEKMASGGTYSSLYYLPGGGALYPQSTFRRK